MIVSILAYYRLNGKHLGHGIQALKSNKYVDFAVFFLKASQEKQRQSGDYLSIENTFLYDGCIEKIEPL